VVAKVPVHTPGEHPMFKAMAAATGRHDDETDDSAQSEDVEEAVIGNDGDEAQTDGQLQEQVAREAADEDLDDGDFDDSEDDDEVELDDDEDIDDEDLEDEDEDDEDVDLDLDDDLDVEDSANGDDADDSDQEPSVVTAPAGPPRRRRAAVRPAGPPIHDD
jgi:ribonuclease E